MPQISRRQAIQGVGSASLAALASIAVPGCKEQPKELVRVPDPKSLYLIFTGAWAFCFENNMLNVVTTHYDAHSYDLGVSLPSDQPRMPLEKDQVYTVSIGNYSPASSIPDLVAPLKGQSLILKGIYRKPDRPKGIRTITLPMPSSMSPAALLSKVTINVDASIPHDPVTAWPTAIALVYSGAWQFATIKSSDSAQPVINITAGALPYSHLSFRTCLTAECNMTPDCTTNCAKVNQDISHVNDVFGSLMNMVDFQGKPQPDLTFPPCTAGTSGSDNHWPVGIAKGLDSNIDKSEIGMPAVTCDFSKLRNCAAGTVIVGA